MSLFKDAPTPRLCHLVKWPDFSGYGFNLHSDKGKTGKYIGSVDENSPAKAAGLEPGDIIIEVNGNNIGSDNHNAVVERIKSRPNEASLLVMNPSGESYYSQRMIPIKSTMPNVQVIQVPRINPFTQKKQEINKDIVGEFSIRLCKLQMWPEFTGYGFNLQSIEGMDGQFMGAIDSDSPAERACLKEGDKLIEVNDQDVTSMTHRDVVRLIMLSGKQVQLLVVDRVSDEYFKTNGIPITRNSPYLSMHSTPLSNASLQGRHSVENSHLTSLDPVPIHQNDNSYKQYKPLVESNGSQLNDNAELTTSNETYNKDMHNDNQNYLHDNKHISMEDNKEKKIEHFNTHEIIETHHSHDKIGSIDSQINVDFENINKTSDLKEDYSYKPLVISEDYRASKSDTSNGHLSFTLDKSKGSMLKTEDTLKDYEHRHSSMPHKNVDGIQQVNLSTGASKSNASLNKEHEVNIPGFAGSAKEARERMNKKKNIKSGGLSIRDKYELLQRM